MKQLEEDHGRKAAEAGPAQSEGPHYLGLGQVHAVVASVIGAGCRTGPNAVEIKVQRLRAEKPVLAATVPGCTARRVRHGVGGAVHPSMRRVMEGGLLSVTPAEGTVVVVRIAPVERVGKGSVKGIVVLQAERPETMFAIARRVDSNL